jgi:hypothetical protein
MQARSSLAALPASPAVPCLPPGAGESPRRPPGGLASAAMISGVVWLRCVLCVSGSGTRVSGRCRKSEPDPGRSCMDGPTRRGIDGCRHPQCQVHRISAPPAWGGAVMSDELLMCRRGESGRGHTPRFPSGACSVICCRVCRAAIQYTELVADRNHGPGIGVGTFRTLDILAVVRSPQHFHPHTSTYFTRVV